VQRGAAVDVLVDTRLTGREMTAWRLVICCSSAKVEATSDTLSHYAKGSCTFYAPDPEVQRLEKLQNLSNSHLGQTIFNIH
jgi:hypothetical protein